MMSLRFCMTALLAVAAVSCAQTDQKSTTTRVAAASPRPACTESMLEGQSDLCSAKTMAGQRPPAQRPARL
jgi:hypothetical protein